MSATASLSLPGTADGPRVGARGWAALVVLMLPVLLVSVDNTVLSFALPEISTALRPSGVAAALDHRRVPARARRAPRHDGHARRPLRAPQAPAHRRDRFRARLGARRLRADAGLLIAARALLGFFGAMLMPSTLSLLRSVFQNRDQRRLAIADLGGRVLGRISARPDRRRPPARALRLGFRVPRRRAGADPAADPRADPGAGEPGPEPGPHRPAQHRCCRMATMVPDRVRDQGVRGRRASRRSSSVLLRARHRRGPAVRAPPAARRDADARHGAVPRAACSPGRSWSTCSASSRWSASSTTSSQHLQLVLGPQAASMPGSRSSPGWA